VNRCGSGVLIRGDRQLITAMLMNLLSNAILHAKNAARVSVSLLESPRNVVLAVDDDGCGIPPEELPRVLDRYRHGFRLDQMNAGPGLGLTAVRLVAQAHGGALLLESRPEQGTTVRVSLERGERELLHAPEEPPTLETRELLTGLADCLPADCFREQYLD
jgi:signal transduction histidine kinase